MFFLSFFSGIPVYFCESLIEMSDWGGMDMASLKKGIDNIFWDKGRVPSKDDQYKHKVIGCTSDGASVNFGRNTSLMRRLAVDRPWLIKIHSTNHRIELAVKKLLKNITFNECDTFYIWNFALLKNSGKIKGEIKAAAQALNIKHFTLPKLTSTRFVGHCCNAYTRLLNLWPAITMAYENVCADENTKPDTKAKVTGYLAKLRSYSFLCLVMFIIRYSRDCYTNIKSFRIRSFDA